MNIMLQATDLGEFNYYYNTSGVAQDLTESFITEANQSSRAFSENWVRCGVPNCVIQTTLILILIKY
jgi:hypothetical protein